MPLGILIDSTIESVTISDDVLITSESFFTTEDCESIGSAEFLLFFIKNSSVSSNFFGFLLTRAGLSADILEGAELISPFDSLQLANGVLKRLELTV